jgi:dihydrofolate synthase / folylpolyglutamate synthase
VDLAGALEYLDRHTRRPRTGAPGPVGAPPASADDRASAPVPGDPLGMVLDAMGDPQRSYPVILVAGSPGAATVTHLLGAVLAASGLTVATLVGAGLESVGERVARNGETIAEADLAEALSVVADLEPLVVGDLSWSEVVTAAALGWFAQVAVDVAVIEVGSPGNDDAAARVIPLVTVIAAPDPVAAARLADWVPSDSVVVLGEPDEESREALARRRPAQIVQRDIEFEVEENLAAVGGRVVDLRTPQARYQELFVPLHGAATGDATVLAVAGAEAFFGRELDGELVSEGLAAAVDPGHFEVVGHGPLVVIDAAQEPEAAQRVAATLRDDFEVSGRRLLVIGASLDADITDLLESVEAGSFDEVIVTGTPAPEGVDARVVAAAAIAVGLDPMVVPEVGDAVEAALAAATPDDAIVITGSPRVAGAARAHLRTRRAFR